MNRRSWWLAMVAPQVVAQQTKELIKIGNTEASAVGLFQYTVNGFRVIWSNAKGSSFLGKAAPPVNNECPVCGTMASPYTWTPPHDCGSSVYISVDIKTGRHTTVSACDKPPIIPANLTRCNHCNAAFWQEDTSGKP